MEGNPYQAPHVSRLALRRVLKYDHALYPCRPSTMHLYCFWAVLPCSSTQRSRSTCSKRSCEVCVTQPDLAHCPAPRRPLTCATGLHVLFCPAQRHEWPYARPYLPRAAQRSGAKLLTPAPCLPQACSGQWTPSLPMTHWCPASCCQYHRCDSSCSRLCNKRYMGTDPSLPPSFALPPLPNLSRPVSSASFPWPRWWVCRCATRPRYRPACSGAWACWAARTRRW